MGAALGSTVATLPQNSPPRLLCSGCSFVETSALGLDSGGPVSLPRRSIMLPISQRQPLPSAHTSSGLSVTVGTAAAGGFLAGTCRLSKRQSRRWRCLRTSRLRKQAASIGDAVVVEEPGPVAPSEPLYPAHLRSIEAKRGLAAGRFVQGELRMLRNTCYFAVVSHGTQEIVISGSMAMNRSVDGDTVVVELLDVAQREAYDSSTKSRRHRLQAGGKAKSEAEDMQEALESQERRIGTTSKKGPRGRVVYIVKRSKRALMGSIQPVAEHGKRGPESVAPGDRVFLPSDKRFPFVVLRPPSEDAGAFEGKRVSIALDVWDRFAEYPRGHLVKVLGDPGDIEVETQMILSEYSVKNEPFSDEVLKELPPEDFQPSEKDLEGRDDLRDVCVVSIDPPGCEDVDDALSCEELPNGNFRVGVHIADVTHFVRPNSNTDREAAERCTSVYLVDRRIDMLPRLLTTQICSLRCDGKDRLTFSAIIEMTPNAEVVSERFCKSVIRSRAALSYKDAQERLDSGPEQSDEITVAIKQLNKLAVILRANRINDGALELESEEVSFELDEDTKLPTSVFKYQSYSTNKLIEEFMLLANKYAAITIANSSPKFAVLRQHPAPKADDIRDLTKLLACHGITEFDSTSNKALAESLDKVGKPGDPFFNRLVRVMTTRCMNEALYFCTGLTKVQNWGHYGLAMDRYTHFTSPIRRYADCVVHRFLAAAIGVDKIPKAQRDKDSIQSQVMKLNTKHKNAQWADRTSTALHQHLYFKAKGAVTVEGVVMRVKEGRPPTDDYQLPEPCSVQVAVEEHGVEGYADLAARDWRVIPGKQRAQGRPLSPFQGKTISIFDRIVVRVEADPDDTRALKFTFVSILDTSTAGTSAAAAASVAAEAASDKTSSTDDSDKVVLAEADIPEKLMTPSVGAVAERKQIQETIAELSAE